MANETPLELLKFFLEHAKNGTLVEYAKANPGCAWMKACDMGSGLGRMFCNEPDVFAAMSPDDQESCVALCCELDEELNGPQPAQAAGSLGGLLAIIRVIKKIAEILEEAGFFQD